MHQQPPQIRPQTISPNEPHFSPTKKVCSPQQQETKNRAFPRLDHYPKCSFHKDMRFPYLRDTRDQGVWVHRGYSRYGQHVRYNKTIPVAAHGTYAVETSLLEGMEKGQIPWDINAGRVFLWIVAGYVDSITTLPIPSDLAARIPNRSFVHGIRTSRRLWSWHESSPKFHLLSLLQPEHTGKKIVCKLYNSTYVIRKLQQSCFVSAQSFVHHSVSQVQCDPNLTRR